MTNMNLHIRRRSHDNHDANSASKLTKRSLSSSNGDGCGDEISTEGYYDDAYTGDDAEYMKLQVGLKSIDEGMYINNYEFIYILMLTLLMYQIINLVETLNDQANSIKLIKRSLSNTDNMMEGYDDTYRYDDTYPGDDTYIGIDTYIGDDAYNGDDAMYIMSLKARNVAGKAINEG